MVCYSLCCFQTSTHQQIPPKGAGKSPNCSEFRVPHYKINTTILSAFPTSLGFSVEQTK